MKIFALILVIIALISCKEDSIIKNGFTKNAERCDYDGKVVKKVAAANGMMLFDSVRNSYAIRAAIPGTYDSVDYGYLCNTPEELKKPGLKIQFYGIYKNETKSVNAVAGAKVYDLSISAYKIL